MSLTWSSAKPRIFVVEIVVKREVEGAAWQQHESTAAYFIGWDMAEVGLPLGVQQDNVTYSEVASISACVSMASSYFYDHSNRRLYIHTSDGDSPNTKSGTVYKYCILVETTFGLCSQQQEDNRVIFPIANKGYPYYYLPYLSQDAISEMQEGIGEFFISSVEYGEGTIKLINDGWCYFLMDNFLLIGGLVELYQGEIGCAYSELEQIGVGIINEFVVEEAEAEIRISDLRSFVLSKTIPLATFDTAEYANLEPDKVGSPVSLVFGKCRNVVPVCIDTINFVYKITNYKIKSVKAVYKGELTLIEGIDYTVDLDNAEITLNNDPEGAVITADVEGIQVADDENTFYTDRAHQDSLHADQYNDAAHADVAHSDSYSDATHADTPHSDVPHTDSYTDYTDESHYDGA